MSKIIQSTVMLLIISGFLWLTTNCSDEGVHPLDVQFVIPADSISFYDHIQPMLEIKCGFGSGCHSSTDIENGLMYTHLVDKNALMEYNIEGEKLVDLDTDIKNPQSALLYLIVREGYPDVPRDRMPPYWLNRAPLSENQIEGIKNWIGEGAKD